MELTYDPAKIRELEATINGFQESNSYFVSKSGTELSLSGHGSWDLGSYWIVPKIATLMNCSVESAVSYLFIGLIVSTLVLTAFGALLYYKGGVHKLIHFLLSAALLALLTSQNDMIEQISFFWIISSFPLYLWIHRSRRIFLPTLLLIPLSLLGCICFLMSWRYGGGFYVLSCLLLFLSEKGFIQKFVYGVILFVPLLYSIHWTQETLGKAVVRIQQVERVEVKPKSLLPIWHDLLKGLGQYENEKGLEKDDRGVFEYISRQGLNYKFMSDRYLSLTKKYYFHLIESDMGFVGKTYFKKALDLTKVIVTGKMAIWIFGKIVLITFLIWGLIGLVKHFVVQKDYKVTLPFILVFLLLSLLPILTVINYSTCTPMIAFLYCYFTTMGIWDWERVSGDHFPLF